MNLVPKSVEPYMKAWVALIGVVLVALATSWEAAPEWVAIAASVATAVGVYLVPNGKPERDPNLRA